MRKSANLPSFVLQFWIRVCLFLPSPLCCLLFYLFVQLGKCPLGQVWELTTGSTPRSDERPKPTKPDAYFVAYFSFLLYFFFLSILLFPFLFFFFPFFLFLLLFFPFFFFSFSFLFLSCLLFPFLFFSFSFLSSFFFSFLFLSFLIFPFTFLSVFLFSFSFLFLSFLSFLKCVEFLGDTTDWKMIKIDLVGFFV